MRRTEWTDARLARLASALDQVSRREITRADFRSVWALDIDAARARVDRWRRGVRPVSRRRPWHTDETEPREGVLAWRRRRHERLQALAEAVTKLVRFLTESRL